MFDCIEPRNDVRQPPVRQHQRIAAGKNYFPDFFMRGDVIECAFQRISRQHIAVRPDLLAAETKAAIHRTGMQQFQKHAVGIAVHDAFDRAMRLIANRIGAFLRMYVQFLFTDGTNCAAIGSASFLGSINACIAGVIDTANCAATCL